MSVLTLISFLTVGDLIFFDQLKARRDCGFRYPLTRRVSIPSPHRIKHFSCAIYLEKYFIARVCSERLLRMYPGCSPILHPKLIWRLRRLDTWLVEPSKFVSAERLDSTPGLTPTHGAKASLEFEISYPCHHIVGC